MATMIFNAELNDFCRKYFVKSEGASPSLTSASIDKDKIEATIFEQLLLFDSVTFKVHGENIPFILLLKYFGQKGLESLIEQDAINFVLWTNMVTYSVSDIEGIEPLQSGVYSSKAHIDPEESINLAFNWMPSQLRTSDKRHLIKKVRDKYTVLDNELSRQTVSLTKSAYNSGKLKAYGLTPDICDFIKLKLSDRKKLCDCANNILQHSYLMSNNISSYNNFEDYEIFNNTQRKLYSALNLRKDFNELTKLENMPNLYELYSQINEPYKNLLKIRNKNNSIKLRKWLTDCSYSSSDIEITKAYIDALANSKDFFETNKGKLVKTVLTSSIGASVGTAVGSLVTAHPVSGAIGGIALSTILQSATGFVFDMVDEFALSSLLKGWTPKLFFDDIEKIRGQNK